MVNDTSAINVMSNDALNRLYEKMLPDLIHWAKNNDKLYGYITEHDLRHLFEFNGIRGLTIDRGRFHSDYYNTVFKGLAISLTLMHLLVRFAL